MTEQHHNTIAMVTGASSGIGAIYADRLAQRGRDLILVARRRERLIHLAAQIEKEYGVNAEVVEADLSKEDDLSQLEARFSANSRINVLVNNAGCAHLGSIAQTSLQDVMAQIAINVVSLTRLTRAAIAEFSLRNEGSLINIGSVLAVHSLRSSSIYSGTKGFVMNFTRGVQQEVSGTNVRVQLVLPSTIATEIWQKAGLSLSELDPESIMSAEELVDAAMRGFDLGEHITWPSLSDEKLWKEYDAARTSLFTATQTNRVASRYQGQVKL